MQAVPTTWPPCPGACSVSMVCPSLRGMSGRASSPPHAPEVALDRHSMAAGRCAVATSRPAGVVTRTCKLPPAHTAPQPRSKLTLMSISSCVRAMSCAEAAIHLPWMRLLPPHLNWASATREWTPVSVGARGGGGASKYAVARGTSKRGDSVTGVTALVSCLVCCHVSCSTPRRVCGDTGRARPAPSPAARACPLSLHPNCTNRRLGKSSAPSACRHSAGSAGVPSCSCQPPKDTRRHQFPRSGSRR